MTPEQDVFMVAFAKAPNSFIFNPARISIKKTPHEIKAVSEAFPNIDRTTLPLNSSCRLI